MGMIFCYTIKLDHHLQVEALAPLSGEEMAIEAMGLGLRVVASQLAIPPPPGLQSETQRKHRRLLRDTFVLIYLPKK